MLTLVAYNHPILRSQSKSVEYFDSSLRDLIGDMKQYIVHRGGKVCGLAAPQVGIAEQIFVARLFDGKQYGFPRVFINPIILKTIGFCPSYEGCLSIPDQLYLWRPWRIGIEYRDEWGIQHTLERTLHKSPHSLV